MADKLRTQQQLEALQNRYVGTGHADTTPFEFKSNYMRDSYASFVGHPPMLQYMSVGMNQSREKTRLQLIEKMIKPAGNPPQDDPAVGAREEKSSKKAKDKADLDEVLEANNKEHGT